MFGFAPALQVGTPALLAWHATTAKFKKQMINTEY
jgi:hypothetical protein